MMFEKNIQLKQLIKLKKKLKKQLKFITLFYNIITII